MELKTDRTGRIPCAKTLTSLAALAVWPLSLEAATVDATSAAARTGSSGLHVTLGCPVPQTVDLLGPPPITASGTYEACDLLRSDKDIQSPASVTFKSGRLTELAAGFSVESGATFAAIPDATLGSIAYVQDSSPSAERAYHARWYTRFDNATLSSDELDIFQGLTASGQVAFRVTAQQSGGQTLLSIAARLDDGSEVSTSTAALGSGFRAVEIDWRASTTPNETDGAVYVLIDNVQVLQLQNLDNSHQTVEASRLGAVTVSDGSGTGDIHIDDFVSRQDGRIGL